MNPERAGPSLSRATRASNLTGYRASCYGHYRLAGLGLQHLAEHGQHRLIRRLHVDHAGGFPHYPTGLLPLVGLKQNIVIT